MDRVAYVEAQILTSVQTAAAVAHALIDVGASASARQDVGDSTAATSCCNSAYCSFGERSCRFECLCSSLNYIAGICQTISQSLHILKVTRHKLSSSAGGAGLR